MIVPLAMCTSSEAELAHTKHRISCIFAQSLLAQMSQTSTSNRPPPATDEHAEPLRRTPSTSSRAPPTEPLPHGPHRRAAGCHGPHRRADRASATDPIDEQTEPLPQDPIDEQPGATEPLPRTPSTSSRVRWTPWTSTTDPDNLAILHRGCSHLRLGTPLWTRSTHTASQ